jgi:hypothetical protein
MFHKLIGLIFLAMLTLASGASAAYEAHSGAGSWIDIREPVDQEGDALLHLGCGELGLVDVHLGGVFTMGKGEHEAVSAALSAGKLTARVKGLSIETADVEMTGGIELLTALRSDDALFAVLTSGKEITLKGGSEKAERFTLDAKTTAALKAFLKTCP